MAKRVKHRRGTEEEIAVFTPAVGEFIYNTTDHTIHTGDGATEGGHKINTAAQVTALIDNANTRIDNIIGGTYNDNLFINGDFKIDQRGAIPFTTSNYNSLDYLQDRWVYRNRDDGATSIFSVININSFGDVLGGRINILAPQESNSAGWCYVKQIVENGVKYLQNDSLTYSLNYKVNRDVTVYLKVYTNGNSGGLEHFIIKELNLTASSDVQTVSTVIESNNFDGLASDRHLHCELTFSLANNDTSRSTGYNIGDWFTDTAPVALSNLPSNSGLLQLNDWLELYGVKLEVGGVATPFRIPMQADELVRCQRYYYASDFWAFSFGADVTSGGEYFCNDSFPTTMLAEPTITMDEDSAVTSRIDSNPLAFYPKVSHLGIRILATSSGVGFFRNSYKADAEL